MSDYRSEEYLNCLEKGSDVEDDIQLFLDSMSEYDGIKYVSYDDDGNVTWQQIDTRFGKKRHPDFLVNNKKRGELVLLLEVKFLDQKYSNKYGIVENLPKDRFYVTAEKAKIDDYLVVQAHYEVECRVVFVIGKKGKNRDYFWENLDNLMGSIAYEGKPYGKAEKFAICGMSRI